LIKAAALRAAAPAGLCPVAAQLVVSVRPARKDFAAPRNAPHVDRLICPGWPRLGLDPAIGEQLGIERVTDRAVYLLHVAFADVGLHVVAGAVTPVLGHQQCWGINRLVIREDAIDKLATLLQRLHETTE
jgi:hypothetical protein